MNQVYTRRKLIEEKKVAKQASSWNLHTVSGKDKLFSRNCFIHRNFVLASKYHFRVNIVVHFVQRWAGLKSSKSSQAMQKTAPCWRYEGLKRKVRRLVTLETSRDAQGVPNDGPEFASRNYWLQQKGANLAWKWVNLWSTVRGRL